MPRRAPNLDPWARGLVVALVLVAGLAADGLHLEALAGVAFVGLILPWAARAPTLAASALALGLVLSAARSSVPVTLVLGVVGGAGLVGYSSSGRGLFLRLGMLLGAGVLAIALDAHASLVDTGHNLLVIAAAGMGGRTLRVSAERRLALARAESELRHAALRDEVMRELHDVAGYAIVAVLTQLRVVRRGLERDDLEAAARGARVAEGAASEAMDDLRGLALLVSGARPAPKLESMEALRRAMAEAVARFPEAELRGGTHGLSARPAPSGGAARRDAVDGDLDPAAGGALLRVVQQSLANAAHHAPDRPVCVEVSEDGETVGVRVTNRLGSGSERGLGLGLRLLRDRVERLDGTLTAEPRGPDFVLECRLPRKGQGDADRHRG